MVPGPVVLPTQATLTRHRYSARAGLGNRRALGYLFFTLEPSRYVDGLPSALGQAGCSLVEQRTGALQNFHVSRVYEEVLKPLSSPVCPARGASRITVWLHQEGTQKPTGSFLVTGTPSLPSSPFPADYGWILHLNHC